MSKFEEGQEVQSLVDRGAPTLQVVTVKEMLEAGKPAGNYLYQCCNGKWYLEHELGRFIKTKIQY